MIKYTIEPSFVTEIIDGQIYFRCTWDVLCDEVGSSVTFPTHSVLVLKTRALTDDETSGVKSTPEMYVNGNAAISAYDDAAFDSLEAVIETMYPNTFQRKKGIYETITGYFNN
jgi:hypothetical protein